MVQRNMLFTAVPAILVPHSVHRSSCVAIFMVSARLPYSAG